MSRCKVSDCDDRKRGKGTGKGGEGESRWYGRSSYNKTITTITFVLPPSNEQFKCSQTTTRCIGRRRRRWRWWWWVNESFEWLHAQYALRSAVPIESHYHITWTIYNLLFNATVETSRVGGKSLNGLQNMMLHCTLKDNKDNKNRFSFDQL